MIFAKKKQKTKIKCQNRWNIGVFECVRKYHVHKDTSYATTISSLFINSILT